MRATILLAAATILLAGCDETPQATAPAPVPPPVVAPAPVPATPPPTMAEIHHRHHHTAWREHSTSSEEYSESEVTDYDYVSDSHVTDVTTNAEDAHARHGYGLWLDGFGRAHDSDIHARRAGTMTRGRLKAWAHYDEDCDR